MPAFGAGEGHHKLVNWRHSVGDSVRGDEKLIEWETDQVVLDRLSFGDSVLWEIRMVGGTMLAAREALALLEPRGMSGDAVPMRLLVAIKNFLKDPARLFPQV